MFSGVTKTNQKLNIMSNIIVLILIMCCIIAAIEVYHYRTDILTMSFCLILSVTSALCAGGLLAGYDFANNCSYKERARTQTKLHGLAMSMLNQYYLNDPDFFLDVITESEEYSEYNAEVEGNWDGFGLQ